MRSVPNHTGTTPTPIAPGGRRRTRLIAAALTAAAYLACAPEEDRPDEVERVERGIYGRSIGPTLPNGGRLNQGDSLFNNGFELVLQSDCNLVLYDFKDAENCDTQQHTRVIWNTATHGRAAQCHAVMQPDGNFVLYDREWRPLWASGTAGRGSQTTLSVRATGQAVVSANGQIFYQSFVGHPSGTPRICPDPFSNPEGVAAFTARFSSMANNTSAPRDVVAICMDALEPPGHKLPPAAEIWGLLGDAQAWFATRSQHRFLIPSFHQFGCGDGGSPVMVPAAQFTGSYFSDYWARHGTEAMMHEFRRIAMETAQARGFDIASFDRNGDGHIAGNELGVIIIGPKNEELGSTRPTTVNLGRVRSVPAVDLILMQSSPNPGYRQALFVHELMHLLTGALDMYSSPMFQAGTYSVMDNMNGLHWIDPFHALKAGWLNAKAYRLQGRGTLTLQTMDAHGDAAILYDPALGAREFFIVTRLSHGGVSVWRIVQDKLRMWSSPWLEAYRGWMESPAGVGEGRWAVHKVNSAPLADGEIFPLELTSGQTGRFLMVDRNPAHGSTAAVNISLGR